MDYRHNLIRFYALDAYRAYEANPSDANYQRWYELFCHSCY